MTDQQIIFANAKKLNECNYLQIKLKKQSMNENNFHFSYNSKQGYLIQDTQLYFWEDDNPSICLDFDSFFLNNYPKVFQSKFYYLKDFGKLKITKIFSNASVIHSISEDGNVYSWGSDSKKYGTLGLDQCFETDKPILNNNFTSRIIEIALSNKHCCALNINLEVFTWGKGEHGELGQGCKTQCSIPIKINLANNLVKKIMTGPTFTLFINKNVLYVGKIYEQEEFSFNEKIEPCTGINVINNLLVHDVSCGSSMIVIIDNFGELYLFNDKNKLYKLKLSYKVKSVTCLNKNFYVLSSNNEYLLEFLYYSIKFNFSNYILNVYSINEELRNNIEFIKNPYFSYNVVFLSSCVDQRILGKLINHNQVFSLVKNSNDIENQFKRSNVGNNDLFTFSSSKRQSAENRDKHNNSPTKRSNERIVLPPNSLKKRNYDKSQEKMKRIENISNLLGNIRIDSRKYSNLNLYNLSSPKKVGNSVDVIRIHSKVLKINENAENNIHSSYLEYKLTGNESFVETIPKNKIKNEAKDNHMNQSIKENGKISPNKNISFSISSPEKKLLVSNYINLSIQCETTNENIISKYERDESSRIKISFEPSLLKSERENIANIRVVKNITKTVDAENQIYGNEINPNFDFLKIRDNDEFIPESKNIPGFELVKNKNSENFESSVYDSSPGHPIKPNRFKNREIIESKSIIHEAIKELNINYEISNNIDNSLKPENEYFCESIKPESNVKGDFKDYIGKCSNNIDNNDNIFREDKLENISTIKLEKTQFLQKSEDPLFSTRMKLEESFPSNEVIKPEKSMKRKLQKQENKSENLNQKIKEVKSNLLQNAEIDPIIYIDKKEVIEENMFNESNIEKYNFSNHLLEKDNFNSEDKVKNSHITILKEESFKFANSLLKIGNTTLNQIDPLVLKSTQDKVTFGKENTITLTNKQKQLNEMTPCNSEKQVLHDGNDNLISMVNKEDDKGLNFDNVELKDIKNLTDSKINFSNKKMQLIPPEDFPLSLTANKRKSKIENVQNHDNNKDEFPKDSLHPATNVLNLIGDKKIENYGLGKLQSDTLNQIEGSNFNIDHKSNNLEEESIVYINSNNINKALLWETIPVNNICNELRSESLFSYAKDSSFSQTDSKKNDNNFLNNLNTNNVIIENKVFQPKNKKAFSIDLRNKNISNLIDSSQRLPKSNDPILNKKSDEKEANVLMKNNELIGEDFRYGTYRSNDISKTSNENQNSIFSKKRIHNSYCTFRKPGRTSIKLHDSDNFPKNKMFYTKELLLEQNSMKKQSILRSSTITASNNELVLPDNQISKKNLHHYDEKKSIDLNESNMSEHFTTNNNVKVSDLNNSNSINDSDRFKNLNLIEFDDKNQNKNVNNDKPNKNEIIQEREKLDCSQAENHEIMNILDNLVNNNNNNLPLLNQISEIKCENVKRVNDDMLINDNYIITNENKKLDSQTPIYVKTDLIKSEENIKIEGNNENILNNENKKISDKLDSPSNKTYSRYDKLEEMKVIEIFAEINEFYRDLRESKKVIEDNLGALKKNIDIKDLKFCNQVIKEVNQDNNIDVNTRALLIKNLEKFKFENVKEKLEKLFSKYKNYGNLSTDLVMCLSSFRKTDEDNKEIYSVFEPLELDKTLQTLLNCSNQISGFNFSNLKLDELIPNISSYRKDNDFPSLENQESSSPRKKILKDSRKDVSPVKRKSVDKGKTIKINEDNFINTLKGSGSQKVCGRSKSDFVSKYLKTKNDVANNFNKNSKIEEVKKIRMTLNQKMNQISKKKEYSSKMEEEQLKKNEYDISIDKLEKETLYKDSRVQNFVSENEKQLKSFHESHMEKIEFFENQKLLTNPISNNNSLTSSSSNNINKGFGRSASINITQSKSPSSAKMNDTIGKNSSSNTPIKVMNVSVTNNKNEKKSVVDLLTSHFRQNNNPSIDRKKAQNNLKQTSLSNGKR